MKNKTKQQLPNILFWFTVITIPVFIIDLIIMTVFYVDKPWWGYVISSVIGLVLGAVLSAAKYSYTSPSGRLKITYWGIPLPALISDGTGNSPWYGFIVNPIYFMLVINVLYVHLIQVDVDYSLDHLSTTQKYWPLIPIFIIALIYYIRSLKPPKN